MDEWTINKLKEWNMSDTIVATFKGELSRKMILKHCILIINTDIRISMRTQGRGL